MRFNSQTFDVGCLGRKKSRARPCEWIKDPDMACGALVLFDELLNPRCRESRTISKPTMHRQRHIADEGRGRPLRRGALV